MTINDTIDTIAQITASVMPKNAEIRVNPQIEHYQAYISWKLNNDLVRENKKSKTIILNVSYDVLEDISSLPEAQQQEAMNRIESHLRSRLESFNPDHNEPRDALSPSVTWGIDSAVAGLTS